MLNNILLWKTIGSEKANFTKLLTKNFFYWSKDSKFSSLNLGDYIFIIDIDSKTVLFATFVGDKGLKVENNISKNSTTIYDEENEEIVEADGSRWKNFIKFRILQRLDVTSRDWLDSFKFQSTNGTLYLYKNLINPKTNKNKFVPSKTVKSGEIPNKLLELSLNEQAKQILQFSIDFAKEITNTDDSFYPIIKKFIEQAKTVSLVTKDYPKEYNHLALKVSFGTGVLAKIPWIALLKGSNKVTDGIYPVYLYYKNLNKIILSFGLSETNTPGVSWDLDNPLTITKFFNDNNFGLPERYGTSYVFKVYDPENLPSESVLNKDLNAIIEIYNQQSKIIKNTDKNETMKIQEKFHLSSLYKGIETSGLLYTNELISRFVGSLITKPFVILTGLSGSGKTKLAQAFVMWICENENQYCIVPVGADWTNKEPLLGFPNALVPDNYKADEYGVLQLIIDATIDSNKPYFLILDEMNLSHVERYFADFLSVMESKAKISLHSGIQNWNGIPPEISFPRNLFIIGTVNIDETTYMFSPKVLDRANVIEFRVTITEMGKHLKNNSLVNLDNLKSFGAQMAQSFVSIAKDESLEVKETDELIMALMSFFSELKKTGAEFGYRSASEILRFAAVLNKIEPEWGMSDIIDAAIMQKLLPKVHGSRRKLEPVLKTLGMLCLESGQKFDDILTTKTEIEYSDRSTIKYPISLEKILRMYNNLLSNGFTSYAEA